MSDYSKKAMLVSLNVSKWTAARRDSRITSQVLEDNGAQAGAGQFTKQLIPKEAFSEINAVVNAARAYHKQITLPWDNDGRRVLSSALFMDYRAKISEFENAYETATRKFINNYPDYIESAKEKLNGLFDWDDYPTIDQLQRKFSLSVTPEPVPSGSSLHVEIADEYLNEQRQLIERRVEEKMKQAHRDIYDRMLETIKHMLKSMDDGKSFKSATIDNIVEICALVPGLTIEEDNEIKRIANEVKATVTKFPREDIIKSPHVAKRTRRELEASVAAITQSMDSFFG